MNPTQRTRSVVPKYTVDPERERIVWNILNIETYNSGIQVRDGYLIEASKTFHVPRQTHLMRVSVHNHMFRGKSGPEHHSASPALNKETDVST